MMEPEVAARLSSALEFAVAAGALLQDRPDELHVDSKSTRTDAVTQMDVAAEKLLFTAISESWPLDGFVGEEGSDRQGSSGFRWIVDPLDGTVNYLYALPGWSVSVGVEYEGQQVAGVVCVPTFGVTYFARNNAGAFARRDDGSIEQLSCGKVAELDMALVGTGFGYDQRLRTNQASVIAALLPAIRDIRRFGSAAADICAVAAGQLDAYFEVGLNSWDYSAATVIAREAGASVVGPHNGSPSRDLVMVANAALQPTLGDQLRRLHAPAGDG